MQMLRRCAVATWAVLGVALLLAESGVRLARFAVPRLLDGLTLAEWSALAVTAIAIGYVEGYRGFSRSFAPRVVARAFDLAHAPTPPHVALAPLYAMSLVGDTRARLVRAWTLLAAIVLMIVGVRQLPHTWRCIVDLSVALSMTWGVLVLGKLWIVRLRRELARTAAA